MNEEAKGLDTALIGAYGRLLIQAFEDAKWRITKYADQAHADRDDPHEILEFEGNCLLNEGINALWTILCSAGGTKFDNTNANIGVGDSNTAADPAQTGLQAATNKLYKGMEASYPTYGSDQKATWRSQFGASEANWPWEEITVANGNSDSGDNLNRKVQSMGTKASPAVWTVDLEITLS